MLGDTVMKIIRSLLFTMVLLSCRTALSTIIYDNTLLSGAATGLTGSNRTIQVDDILIPNSRNPYNLPLAIHSITLDLSAIPGDSGNFSIYLYEVLNDGTPASNPKLIDTQLVTFITPFQQVTFGDSTKILFKVKPDFTAQPGFGLFYIGLEADTIPVADWMWADGPDANLPTAYLDNISAGEIFLNQSPGPPFPKNYSFFVKIDGEPVPEPSTLFLIAISAIGILIHRNQWGHKSRNMH